MLKTFLRDSLLYALSSLLTRGLTFLLLPFYTRLFSPEDFGVLDYLTVLGSFVSVTLALEIAQGVARFMPELLHDPVARRAYASTSFWFTLANYTLLVILVLVFQQELAVLLFDSSRYAGLLVVASVSFWINGLVYLVQGQLTWGLRAKASSLLSMTSALMVIILTMMFVLWLRWGVMGALIAQVLSGLITLAIGFRLTRSNFGFEFEWPRLREMLAYSVPLVPSSVGVIVSYYVDRIVIKELMSLADVGLYGVGYRLAMVASLAMIGLRTALTPLVYAHHKDAGTPAELARIFRIFCALALLLSALLTLFAREAVAILAPPSYAGAATVVPLLTLSVLFSGMYTFAPGLDIAKRTGIIAIINLSAALLNIGLNYALIPPLGIVGSALATSISAVASFCAYMWFSQRLYPVPHAWGPLLAALLMVLIGTQVVAQVQTGTWHDFVLKGLFLIVTAAVIVRLRLLEPVEIGRVWRMIKERSPTTLSAW